MTISNGEVNSLFDFLADLCLEGECFFVGECGAADLAGFSAMGCSASDCFGGLCGLEDSDHRL